MSYVGLGKPMGTMDTIGTKWVNSGVPWNTTIGILKKQIFVFLLKALKDSLKGRVILLVVNIDCHRTGN